MEEEYPSLVERLQSMFIDTVFLLIAMFIASSILDSFDNVPNWIRMSVFIGLFFAYEPLCLAFGCTIGNYIKKIRVKSFNDTDSRINILQALIRYLF